MEMEEDSEAESDEECYDEYEFGYEDEDDAEGEEIEYDDDDSCWEDGDGQVVKDMEEDGSVEREGRSRDPWRWYRPNSAERTRPSSASMSKGVDGESGEGLALFNPYPMAQPPICVPSTPTLPPAPFPSPSTSSTAASSNKQSPKSSAHGANTPSTSTSASIATSTTNQAINSQLRFYLSSSSHPHQSNQTEVNMSIPRACTPPPSREASPELEDTVMASVAASVVAAATATATTSASKPSELRSRPPVGLSLLSSPLTIPIQQPISVQTS